MINIYLFSIQNQLNVEMLSCFTFSVGIGTQKERMHFTDANSRIHKIK